MIDQLDRKPLQVYLATVIGQLTVGNGLEFGVDLLQKFQHSGSYGLATGVVNTSAGGAVGRRAGAAKPHHLDRAFRSPAASPSTA